MSPGMSLHREGPRSPPTLRRAAIESGMMAIKRMSCAAARCHSVASSDVLWGCVYGWDQFSGR